MESQSNRCSVSLFFFFKFVVILTLIYKSARNHMEMTQGFDDPYNLWSELNIILCLKYLLEGIENVLRK